MPRLPGYLPDDLDDELKRREPPAPELLKSVFRAELEGQTAIEHTARYVDELANEVGELSAKQRAQAEAIVRRI